MNVFVCILQSTQYRLILCNTNFYFGCD